MSTWSVGALTVTRIVDLDFPLPSDDPVPDWCVPAFAPSRTEVRIAFSAFLVTGAGAPVVVDPWLANDGPRSTPDAAATASRLLAALAAAGAPADEVALVVNTHLDGIGWNTVPGPDGGWVPAFPRARYLWTADQLAHHAGDDRWAPLGAARVIDPVTAPHELAPGVELVDAPGHERGHAVVWIRDGGASACISGHLFVSPLQVADPSLGFDEDPATAAATRRALLGTLAATGGVLLSPLLGGPGGGRVVPDGDGFALVAP